MDLKLAGHRPTAEELAVIEATVPESAIRIDGRVIRSGHGANAQRHRLLPALAALQSEIGWITPGGLEEVCRRLDIPPAEAWGVATFYALIFTDPRPRRVAHVCDDIACRSAGGVASLGALQDREDVVSSPCLGQCDQRPVAYIQRAGESDLVLTNTNADQIVAALGGDTLAPPSPSRAVGLPDGILARVGEVDPTSLDDYREVGGFTAWQGARELGPEGVITALKTSGLRGRGGAAFPTGVKWESVYREPEAVKYVICNADESEPGTFKDRVLLEGDPFAVVEALAIACWVVGAGRGYVYLRGEYPLAADRLEGAIRAASGAGLLDVEIDLVRGQGAYICGEETAQMSSIEGFRGEPRQKPPFPTQNGLFGKPTVINNVETLVNVLRVLEDPEGYATTGTAQSTGTRLFCLSGDVASPGIYEAELGITLGELMAKAGGVTGDLGTVLLGGAAGSFIPPDRMDLRLSFEDAAAEGLSLGSGVVMAFNTEADMRDVVRRIARFFRDESCGQCVPCRVGTQRIEESLARGTEPDLIDDLDRAMRDASICGLGQTAAVAVRSAIRLGLI